MSKSQNIKIHNSFNKFGRDPSWEYTWIWGSKSGVTVYFRRRCPLRLFISIWSHVDIMAKIQNLKFHFLEQMWFYGRTTDGRKDHG